MYDNHYPNDYTSQSENKQQPAGTGYRTYQNGYSSYQQNNTTAQGAAQQNPYGQGRS